jgi:hypothetical protein
MCPPFNALRAPRAATICLSFSALTLASASRVRHAVNVAETSELRMACPGTRETTPCIQRVYRCKRCGNMGCDCARAGECENPGSIVALEAGVPVCDCRRDRECTNQGFKTGRCCACGGAQIEACS